MRLTSDQLEEVARGQCERNKSGASIKHYLCLLATISRILNQLDCRREALELNEDGTPKYHEGAARNVMRFKFPMRVDVVRKLFAAISIDTSLTKSAKKARAPDGADDDVADVTNDDIPSTSSTVDFSNPAAGAVTVTAQTYQNYKSALKWWYDYESDKMNKVRKSMKLI